MVRIALANYPVAHDRDHSVELAVEGVREAAAHGASIVCFPEGYIPGYRRKVIPAVPPDAAFQERAWATVTEAAGQNGIAVILGTERVVDSGVMLCALVIDSNGQRLGLQDKIQLDPSEDGLYTPADTGRRVFETAGVRFGIAICHEGWRYPETVRAAARQGAQIVFHPHYHWAEPGDHVPTCFADPLNTFHEKAALCRAAENTIFFASINYASENSPTTSVVVRPDGRVLCHQPYGVKGVLVADIDLSEATGLLATRFKPPTM